MNKVLDTIRRIIGGAFIDPHFDQELIIHTNTVLAFLDQLGVKLIRRTIDKNTTWDELIWNLDQIEDVKTYVSFKVKLIFDPPAGSSAMNALEKVIDECEWRLQEAVDLD